MNKKITFGEAMDTFHDSLKNLKESKKNENTYNEVMEARENILQDLYSIKISLEDTLSIDVKGVHNYVWNRIYNIDPDVYWHSYCRPYVSMPDRPIEEERILNRIAWAEAEMNE